MIENKNWKPTKLNDLPEDAKLLSTTWAMKKMANGKYRAWITARGFLQEDGVHYFSHSTAAPVANELTVKICSHFFGSNYLESTGDWRERIFPERALSFG
jgi:hypothetical protein